MRSRRAVEAAKEYLLESGTVRRGIYKISERATEKFSRAYEQIAKLLGFKPTEIFFAYDKRDFNLAEGPFKSRPEGFVDVSTILHRELNYDQVFLEGKAIGVPDVSVVAMKEAILDNLEPKEVGGDMISSVTKDSFQYAELPFKFSAGTPDIASIIALGAAAEEYTISQEIDKYFNQAKEILDQQGINYELYAYSNAFKINDKIVYVDKINPQEVIKCL